MVVWMHFYSTLEDSLYLIDQSHTMAALPVGYAAQYPGYAAQYPGYTAQYPGMQAMHAPVAEQRFVDVVKHVEQVRYQDIPHHVEHVREVPVHEYQDVPVIQHQDVHVPVPVDRVVQVPVPQVVHKVCIWRMHMRPRSTCLLPLLHCLLFALSFFSPFRLCKRKCHTP